jgi:hypothetical protein
MFLEFDYRGGFNVKMPNSKKIFFSWASTHLDPNISGPMPK